MPDRFLPDKPDNERVFRLTLYNDGRVMYEGKKPRNLANVLRTMADGLDSGGFTMFDPEQN